MTTSELRCEICTSTIKSRIRRFKCLYVVLCESCHRLAGRRFNSRRGRQGDRIVEVPARREWIETLKAAWDRNGSCFRCMISGVQLAIDAPESPRYPTLEHTAPGKGQGGWLIVAAAINDMKSDFGPDEFEAAIPLLARIIVANGDTKASSELQKILDGLKHWRRVRSAPETKAIPLEDVG